MGYGINEKATVEVQVNGEQAKKEMQALESYAISLKGRLAEAHKMGDTKQIKELEKELKRNNAQLRKMRSNAKNIDDAMKNLSVAGPKELKQLLRDINVKLNSGNIKRGSVEWKKYQDQLKQVNTEIRKVNNELKESEGWLTRFNNGFSRWGALAASAVAAITGVSYTLSKLRKNRDDKEASAANLEALTGLDDKSIQWLTKQAEIISTTMDKTGLRVTQSSQEILDAYTLVGSAKPELLGNKEALNEVTIEAMRLSKAAKMDLKEAVDAVTLSMNQYGASADEAAKYTNVMAAGSKFGSAAVQSITAAVIKAGVSASGANVSIEELVGSIETLGEKGIKDEVAGTGLKMFFLRLQTGADDTNPKIVGLHTALKNLQKLSTQEIVKRFGAETFSVAQALIEGADKVDYYTKAVTGTNVAMEQAAINSDTNEAKMAQLRNQVKETGIELMEKLNPSLSILTGWTTRLIKATPILIDFFKEYGHTIAYIIVVLSSYTIANKIHWFWLNKVKIETGQYIVIQKLKIFWDKAVAASTWLYIAAESALVGKTKQAGLAMRAFFLILKLNPLSAIATLVIALAGALYLFTRRASDAKRAQLLLNEVHSEASTNISAEKAEIEALYKIAKDETRSKEERLKAIKKLNNISPEYLGALNLETIGTDQARMSVDKYIQSLLTLAEIESAKSRLTDTDKELDVLKKKQKDYQNNNESFWETVKTYTRNTLYMLTFEAVEGTGEKLDNDIKELESRKQQLKDLIEEKIRKNVEVETIVEGQKKKCEECGNNPCTCSVRTGEDEKKKKERLKKALKALETAAATEEALLKAKYARGEMVYRDFCKIMNDNDIKLLDAKMALYDKESHEYSQLLNKKEDLLKKDIEQQATFTLAGIESAAKKEEVALIDSFYNQKINKYALNEALFQLDVQTLQRKQSLYAKDSKDWYDYEQQIIDLENRDKLHKQEKYQQMLSSIREQYAQKDLNRLMQDEIDGIDYLHKAGLLKEEEYQGLLKAIRIKYLQENITQIDEPDQSSETGSFMDTLFGNDLKKLKAKYALIESEENRGTISHQQALQQKAEADATYLEELQNKTAVVYSSLSSMVSAYSDYTNACQDLEIAKIERKYDAEIEAAGANTTKGKKLEAQKEKDIAAIKTKYNKKAMQIEIAQAFAGMAMSAINAYSSAAQVPLIGYILAPLAAGAAIAAGMMQISTIKKQHQAQEAGYYEGGFTGSGHYKKEVGVVHAGEFVANHKAVNNSSLFPVLRLIDRAQRNNTIGSLTAADVTRALAPYASIATPQGVNVSNTVNDDSQLLPALYAVSTVIDNLNKRLNEPFETINTVDGAQGMKRAFDEYNKTQSYKSR